MRVLAAILLAAAAVAGAQPVEIPKSWTARVPAFRIIDNIHYVGTADLASYLITTRDGHILLDTGLEGHGDAVVAGIRQLGYEPTQVRLLLTTQAHFDHVGGHARLARLSGARVLASAEDKPVLEGGGRGDYHFGPRYYFPRVTVDRVVHDGDVVSLGGRSLTARVTPGHTKGTTTWTTVAWDRNGRMRRVVFLGSTAVNEGVRLIDNFEYPQIASDFARSFRIQAALPCEVFLAAHMSTFRGLEKAEAARAGGSEDAFIDPEGCRSAIERSRAAFTTELERQQKARGPASGGQRPPAALSNRS